MVLAEGEADRHVGGEGRHPLPGLRQGVQQQEQGRLVLAHPGQFHRGRILLEPERGQGAGGHAAGVFGWVGSKGLWNGETPWGRGGGPGGGGARPGSATSRGSGRANTLVPLPLPGFHGRETAAATAGGWPDRPPSR